MASKFTDGQRIGLRSHVELAGESLSFVYRLTNFIHHNPLHEFELFPFHEAVRKASGLFGSRAAFPRETWLDFMARGRIRREDLTLVLEREEKRAREEVVLLPGEGGRCLSGYLLGHMLHGWEIPDRRTVEFREERERPLSLRPDLDPEIRRSHENRIRALGPDISGMEDFYLRGLRDASRRFIREHFTDPPPLQSVPIIYPGRTWTLLQWIEFMGADGAGERIDGYLVKWLSAFLDEGVSNWNLPHRERGFYRAWLSLAAHDREIAFWGLTDAFQEIPYLPDNPEDTLLCSLEAMGIPRAALTDYLERHATALPGWLGFVKWRSSHPDDPWQQAYPIDLPMVLAVRLFLEQGAVSDFCENHLGIRGTLPEIRKWMEAHPEELRTRHWIGRHGVPDVWAPILGRFGGDLPPAGSREWVLLDQMREESDRAFVLGGWPGLRAERLFNMAQSLGLSPEEITLFSPVVFERLERDLDAFDRSRQEEIWQKALEARLESELLGKVFGGIDSSKTKSALDEVRPRAQLLFCIDVREGRLRRHTESLGGYATYGLGGFFGVPFRFSPLQGTGEGIQAPVILNPRHRVRELPRAYEIEKVDRHFRRHRIARSLIHLFHELKDHVITPYVFVEIVGWFYLFPLLGKTFFPVATRQIVRFLRSLILSDISTALTVERISETDALAMVEAEQHARIRKALATLLGPHTRSASQQTVEELRQRALEKRPGVGQLSPGAREELSVSLAQESELLRKLRTLYFIDARRTQVSLEKIMTTGFSLEEQAFIVGNVLRMIGLTRNFSRLIVVMAHGSESANNPHESALDCGACGGNSGAPNARVFVEMANNPAVRDLLGRKEGIGVPFDSHFLAGEHNTTSDRIRFFDLEAVPLTHRRDLKRLWQDLEEAGTRTAEERLRSLPVVPGSFSRLGSILRRSCDYSEIRPEWGLAGNAWFVVGRSSLLTGEDLEGRAFLHSYDPLSDTTGRDLETILTGPLVVGVWINAEHYFSAIDSLVFGGGNKVYHNVTGLFGVVWGNGSDLLTGLPTPSLWDGARLVHEPVRSLVLVEAPRERIESILMKNPVLRNLFQNEWVHLIAVDPEDRKFYRYTPPSLWEAIPNHVVSERSP